MYSTSCGGNGHINSTQTPPLCVYILCTQYSVILNQRTEMMLALRCFGGNPAQFNLLVNLSDIDSDRVSWSVCGCCCCCVL